ncbi:MAG: GGDEF domain-containing protein [Burkholderiales bacterium]
MDPIPALEQAVGDAPDTVGRVRALNALSTELARTGQPRRAFAYADEARTLAAKHGDRQLVAETGHAVGRCHFYLADFMRALEYLLEAAQMYEDVGDQAGAAAAFAGVGLCQHRLGANDDAVASMLRALESARAQSLATLEISVHNSLGAALISAGRMDEAARYLRAGLELAQAANNRSLLTKLLHNQSLLAKQRGDELAGTNEAAAQQEYAKGLAQVTRALELARELGNPYDEMHSLGQTGTMLRLLHSHAEAMKVLDGTIDLARRLNEPFVQAEAMMERGSSLMAQGRHAEARQSLSEAIVLARQIGASGVLAETCQSLSGMLEHAGDYEGALALYKEFHAVREAELASSRKHAASAAQLWLDFQEASRRASQYRERAETLAADHAALARKAKALTEVSEQDPLTSLLNRRGLDARIDALVEASDASGEPVTVALIDVDRFKRINDTFSHAVGDAVLRRVSAIMREQCRQDDLPVRYGGDEFLLVLAGADIAMGTRVLARLKDTVDAWAWDREAAGLAVTLSIGIAQRPRRGAIATAIAAADQALYDAKAAGRNRIATKR